MKKKILSLFIAILLLLPCFTFNVAAQSPKITILNNGQNLEYMGNNFVRFDASMVEFKTKDYYDGVKYNVGNIKSVDYDLSPNNAIIRASFTYNDGSILTATFINENFYYSEYQRLTQNPSEYTIKFSYPSYNTITADVNAFYGEKTNLYGENLWHSDQMDVTANMEDDSFYIYKGCLLIVDSYYYYLDYAENDITDADSFDPYEIDGWIEVYKITDPDLCEQLDEANAESNGGFDGLFSGIFSQGLGTVLLSITFGVFPLAALILFLILALRAKTPVYKKLFTAITITAAAELVVFAITIILLIIFKQ